jgi:3-hydroxyisobutyrate dehydrogenase-like beta-hydroxyacid dehydrogenase
LNGSGTMRLGFLGIGNMGLPMAGRLIDAGHEVWISDIRDEAMQPLLERQARRADSPKALADACDVVIVSLPTLDVFRNAVTGDNGLLAGATLKTIVNTCTVGGPFVSEMADACSARGVTLIDAPISGGPAGARAGTLAVMVSGKRDVIDHLMPVFQVFGTKVVVAGDKVGVAQTMKLTNNIIFATCLIATSEAMAMATRGGVEPGAMLDVLNNATGRNFSSMYLFPNNVVPGTFDFGATIDVLMKDVDLAIEEGEALGIPMWVSQAARLVVKHAVFQGRGPHDMSRLAEITTTGG